jgi:nucleotide-binding universal stress UspA family protein
MKTFLVPIDFSPPAKNAFLYACNLAAEVRGKVKLLHVYAPGSVEPYAPIYFHNELVGRREELTLNYLAEIEKEIPQEILSRIELDFNLELGTPVDEILRAIRKENPDLVIMGMRGGGFMQKKIMGTVTNGVIARTTGQVLVIPENVRYEKLDKIAYATNFEHEDIFAISEMLSFARLMGGELHCIHVQKDGQQEVEDVYKQEILKKAFQHEWRMNTINFESITYHKVIEGLNMYVERENIDLLVMLTHTRGLFSRLFHQSHTREMALQTQVPLWIFQTNNPQNNGRRPTKSGYPSNVVKKDKSIKEI